MQTTFSYILLALVTAHSALGCCFHHAHAGGTECCGWSAATVDDDCSCHEHQHRNDVPTTESQLNEKTGHGSGPVCCEEGHCSYTLPNRSGRSLGKMGKSPFLAAHVEVSLNDMDFCARSRAQWASPIDQHVSTIRLHLLLSILLI